jgi:hypothetical protein
VNVSVSVNVIDPVDVIALVNGNAIVDVALIDHA